MKKKSVGVILCIMLVVTMLIGCGNSENGDSGHDEAEGNVAAEDVEKPEDSANEVTQEAGDELTIYIVRHGKTFFNATGQVQGFCDSPLNEEGVEQAKKVGIGMADMEFVAAYCGELGRQRKTAQLILGENSNAVPELKENIGFNEWNYGGYEGGTNAAMWEPVFGQLGYTFDEEWTHYEKVFEELGDRGIADAIAANDELGAAESYDEILARAGAAMDQMVEESLAAGGGNVLIVSSGSQIPTILEMYVADDYNVESINNCSVTILTYKDGGYTLESINDTSYIEAE